MSYRGQAAVRRVATALLLAVFLYFVWTSRLELNAMWLLSGGDVTYTDGRTLRQDSLLLSFRVTRVIATLAVFLFVASLSAATRDIPRSGAVDRLWMFLLALHVLCYVSVIACHASVPLMSLVFVVAVSQIYVAFWLRMTLTRLLDFNERSARVAVASTDIVIAWMVYLALAVALLLALGAQGVAMHTHRRAASAPTDTPTPDADTVREDRTEDAQNTGLAVLGMFLVNVVVTSFFANGSSANILNLVLCAAALTSTSSRDALFWIAALFLAIFSINAGLGAPMVLATPSHRDSGAWVDAYTSGMFAVSAEDGAAVSPNTGEKDRSEPHLEAATTQKGAPHPQAGGGPTARPPRTADHQTPKHIAPTRPTQAQSLHPTTMPPPAYNYPIQRGSALFSPPQLYTTVAPTPVTRQAPAQLAPLPPTDTPAGMVTQSAYHMPPGWPLLAPQPAPGVHGHARPPQLKPIAAPPLHV